MTKVLVTEQHLEDIADAIRYKTGESDTYRPGDMAAAIRAIEAGYPEPTGTIQITQNGVTNVKDYASANVSVQPNLQAKTATRNGTVTADSGYDGLSSVAVNVSGGGGGDWPFVDEITEGGTNFVMNVSGSEPLDVNDLPANVRTFYNDYARTPKPTTCDYDIDVTGDDAGLTLAELKVAHAFQLEMEYYGNIYENTTIIDALGLVLLGDFSQGGTATGNALSGSINDYSAVILQGIYSKQRGSNYNTSMLYKAPALNRAYWAGMKDRNHSYDCYVTFTDANTVSLSGNRQVMIYGVP